MTAEITKLHESASNKPRAPSKGAEKLATLVHLGKRARSAQTHEELAFILVNETLALMDYRQAVLVARGRRGREVLAASGVAVPEKDAPYIAWFRRLNRFLTAKEGTTPYQLTSGDVPTNLSGEWDTWLPPQLLVVPLPGGSKGHLCLGRLFFAVEVPLDDGSIKAIGLAAEIYGHAWESLQKGPPIEPRSIKPRRPALMALLVIAALAGASAVPIQSNVLAPAEVIPREPAVMRAPLDGIVEKLHVRPNEAVREGQLLATLDQKRLRTQLEVARRGAAATEAELRQAQQAAVTDPRARSALPTLQGRLDQQLAEAIFVEDQLNRVEIRSPRDGIAIIEDPAEWPGRPVSLGERILLIADPGHVELEIRMPVADAIALAPGAEAKFFRNTDPSSPLPASLSFAAYRASPGPDGVLAYRLKAQFAGAMPPPRIGLKGTAKVYGDEVPLGLHLLRRPFAAIRQATGW